MSRFATDGRVEWIGIRPQRRAAVQVINEVRAIAGQGLEGDHYRPGSKGERQVTLLQMEHLDIIGRLLGTTAPEPAQLRRNLAVSGINVLALKGVRFQIGEAILEGTATCPPCSRMEEVLGYGGYNAMRGHGGIAARILREGIIRVGDSVTSLEPSEGSSVEQEIVTSADEAVKLRGLG